MPGTCRSLHTVSDPDAVSGRVAGRGWGPVADRGASLRS
jgi:hypothetical protein